MARKHVVFIRVLSFALVFWLLMNGHGSVRAAVTPQQIAAINQAFRFLAITGTISPLQAAIAESEALDCANKLPDPSKPGALYTCTAQALPEGSGPVVYPVIVVLSEVKYYLPGAWATRAIYPGQGAADGTMTIDKNNVGTLTSGSGTATLLFSRYNDPDGTTYIVYAYRTSEGDRGSGVLQPSVDGCVMYGGYHSVDDPKTVGTFLMARC